MGNSSSSLVVAGLLLAGAASAQISVSGDSWTVSENFDRAWSTAQTYSTVPWTDGTTIPGWSLYRLATGTPTAVTTAATISSSSSGPIFLISHVDTPTNFILGSRVTDAEGGSTSTPGAGYYFGIRLRNDSGAVIDSVQLSYTGVQWYRSTGANASEIVPAYQVVSGGLANLAAGTWTEVPDQVYVAPVAGSATASTANFNLSQNRNAFAPTTLASLGWQPGTDLWVRWFIGNVSGVDQGVGIDDVVIASVAIPEPSTLALGLAGLGLGGLAVRRRSRS